MSHFGLFNVNKPTGITSRDVVDRLERLVRPARAGHAGTLDPLATGVLVICVGQATRLIQYIQRLPKCYRASFLLGQTSDTDDVEGQLSTVAQVVQPSREMLDDVLARFIGSIEQRPPAHSAIKVAGRRAYALARRGVALELQPRTVQIHKISVRGYAYPKLELDVECGSGTYIRALGRDIGAALGTGAVMSSLERTAVGIFRLEDAVDVCDLQAESFAHHLQPAIAAVADLPRVRLTEAQLLEIRHGRPIPKTWLAPCGRPSDDGAEVAAVDMTGRLVAILFEKRPRELWPRMNFT
jgi:tRNA pseudouridine55 synthase